MKTYTDVLLKLAPISALAAAHYVSVLQDKNVKKWPIPPDGWTNLATAVVCSFTMAQTTQGAEFWQELYLAILKYEKRYESISVA